MVLRFCDFLLVPYRTSLAVSAPPAAEERAEDADQKEDDDNDGNDEEWTAEKIKIDK